jgi:hypothetical protein
VNLSILCKSRKQIIIIITIIKAWIIENCDFGRCKSGWFMWIGVTIGGGMAKAGVGFSPGQDFIIIFWLVLCK